MNNKKYKLLVLSIILQNIFQVIFLTSIAPSALSQNTRIISQKTNLIFQSQFSQNLTKNFQEAKSEGCFVLYDLKCDRFSNIIFT